MVKKKKRRRYRLNWSALLPEKAPHISKKLIVLLLCIAILVITIIKLPSIITSKKLQKLGYSKDTAAIIEKDGLATRILNYQYYSPYLEQSFQDNTVNGNYLPLYLNMYQDRKLSAVDFLLCQRLQDIGYDTDQIQNLYANLSFNEILPLLLYDYQYNEQPYIDDVVANRTSDDTFKITGSYYSPYENVKTITTLSTDVLVNQRHMLTKDVVPSQLTPIDTTYAVEGIQLDKDAAIAYQQMAQKAGSEGIWFYAISGYLSYDAQQQYYDTIAFYNGANYAYYYIPKAGASEQQTGLSVAITAANHESEDFTTTQAYKWLQENATDYGFIFRYQEGQQEFTNYPAESNFLRYVGKDLAKEVNESGLAYDLFYQLYLASWNEEKYIPDSDVLDNITYKVTTNYHVQDDTSSPSPTPTSSSTPQPRTTLNPIPQG